MIETEEFCGLRINSEGGTPLTCVHPKGHEGEHLYETDYSRGGPL